MTTSVSCIDEGCDAPHADEEDCALPRERSFLSRSSLKNDEFRLISGGAGKEIGGREYRALFPLRLGTVVNPLEFNELVRRRGFLPTFPSLRDQSEDMMLSLVGEVSDKTDLLALLAKVDLFVVSTMPLPYMSNDGYFKLDEKSDNFSLNEGMLSSIEWYSSAKFNLQRHRRLPRIFPNQLTSEDEKFSSI